jgi:hypothetical protein
MNRVLALLALTLTGAAAQAQLSAAPPDLTPLQACLQTGSAKPSYPSRDLQMRAGGHVRLGLRFSAPDKPPKVEVLFRAASEEMLDEVQNHVRRYRLPCLPAGEASALLVQEFEFKPRVTDPITWTEPRAVAAEGPRLSGREVLACVRTPDRAPEAVGTAFTRDTSNVVALMKFTAPDQPPEVRLTYASASASGSQRSEVEAYLRDYRLPCLKPGAAPVEAEQHFQFRPYGVRVRVFKDAVGLTTFLSNIKGIRQMRTDFDFNTMACPFQVAWRLGRPAVPNSVGEVGARDLNRTEFLAWLGGLEMDLKEVDFEQLLGRTLLINVGCGTLALAPST